MKFSAPARTRARRLAMQALYQWELSGTALSEIGAQFLETEDFARADRSYFIGLLNKVSQDTEIIENNISEYIDRPIDQLNPVEHAILRLAICELLFNPAIPFRVTINEAVQLARKFGAEQGHRFVNAVLDRAARKLRPDECSRSGEQAAGR
ncbi:MAG: transcription antitermination factor NusB [Gammaproteobacteria bacterium]|jgi:N utilization substance protein B